MGQCINQVLLTTCIFIQLTFLNSNIAGLNTIVPGKHFLNIKSLNFLVILQHVKDFLYQKSNPIFISVVSSH